jgi:hypothetical protein
VAPKAASREAVKQFHAESLETGAKDNGAPGLRVDYGPDYYAAFPPDPEGNNLEAVCLRWDRAGRPTRPAQSVGVWRHPVPNILCPDGRVLT